MTPFGISESVWMVTSDLVIGVFVATVILCWAAYTQQQDSDDSMMPDLPLPPEMWLMTILVIVLWWDILLIGWAAVVLSLAINRE